MGKLNGWILSVSSDDVICDETCRVEPEAVTSPFMRIHKWDFGICSFMDLDPCIQCCECF